MFGKVEGEVIYNISIKALKKNQLIAVMVVLLVLIFGGIFYFSLPKEKKTEISLSEEVASEEIVQEEPLPIFSLRSLSAKILEINLKDNYLLVKPIQEEKEIKVNLSEDTEIIRLKFPFDPKNPPKEATFALEVITIKIGDLKINDQILIETAINITGKVEFNDVRQIQVMP